MILSPFSYIFIFEYGETYLKILGLLLLIPIYINVKYWWKVIHTPKLSLKNNIITICNDFGKIYIVNPIDKYSLVISNDYLGFREKGEQDIMVDRKYFKDYEWHDLIKTLKQLPFIELIQGIKQ